LKLVSNNIHFIYKYLQICFGYINVILPPSLRLSPLVLRIRITNKCNLHCNFCYLAGSLNIGEDNHLTIEEWKKIISNLPVWTIVDITGAEPFLAKNFKEILELLMERKFKISLTTNGYHVNESILNSMVKNKLYYLMISIDGTREYHNNIRGHDKSFEQIEKFLVTVEALKKKYNSNYPLICIKSTVTDNNIDEISVLNDEIFNKYQIHSHSLNLMFQNQARGGIILENDFKGEKFSSGNTFQYDELSKSDLIKKLKNFITRMDTLKRPINIKPPVKISEVGKYIDNPGQFGVKDCNRYNSIQTLYFDGAITPCDIGFKLVDIRKIDYKLSNTWKEETFKKFKQYFHKSTPFPAACDACCLADQCEKN
jgi:MoaA/NifB/PqqE/SkfB family radical SAM enzyme